MSTILYKLYVQYYLLFIFLLLILLLLFYFSVKSVILNKMLNLW